MRISRSLLFGAMLVTAVAMLSGCGRSGGGGGATSGGGAGPKSAQGRSLGIMPVGSTLLGLHAGDRIPAQGRSVTALTGKGTTIPLDAPLVLYPNAVVQGVAWVPTPPGFELWVLLGTDDPEATVLQYYTAAWQGQPVVQPKPRASLLYGRAAPNVMSQLLIAKTGKDHMSSVEIQRGPVVQPMDERQYAQVLLGNGTLPLQPGGATTTEISLIAPAG